MMTEDEVYSAIENTIIKWVIDGTKTAGSLTREIMLIIKKMNNTYINAINKVVDYLLDEDKSLLELLYTDFYNEDTDEPSFHDMSTEELYMFCIDNKVDHIWVSVYELQMYLASLSKKPDDNQTSED